MSKKCLTLLISFILISMLSNYPEAESVDTNKKLLSNPLTGTIFINVEMPIDWNYKYIMKGLSINFPKAEMRHIYEEEVAAGDDTFNPESKYDEFMFVFKNKREYRDKIINKIEHIFSEYNLESLDNFFYEMEGKCYSRYKSPYYSEPLPNHFPSRRFMPNRQLSYSLYSPRSFSSSVPTLGRGILINVETKEISYPFECDNVEISEWSPDGQYIAYSYEDSKTLVIKDIANNKIVFKIDFKNEIDDITWDPNSEHVAVMSRKSRIGLLPWELLLIIPGHPVSYNSYYLNFFNLDGAKEYHFDVVKSKKHAQVRMMWTTSKEPK